MAGWIGAAISAAAGVGGTLNGIIQGGRARRKAKRDLQRQKAEENALFNHEYYQDLTQRSDMQYLLRNLRETNQANNDRARRTAVVAGKSTEAEAASKEAGSQALANATAQIGAKSEQTRQNALARHEQNRRAFNNAESSWNALAAQQASNAVANGVTTAVKGVGSLASTIWDKAKDSTTTTTDKEDEEDE